MTGFFSRKRAGFEICTDRIRAVLVARDRKGVKLKAIHETPSDPGMIKPGFAALNILDTAGFTAGLRSLYKQVRERRAAVVLPDASIKVLIRRYTDLPDEDRLIGEMITWNIASSLNLSPDELRVSWQYMGKTASGQHVFLVALGLETIIQQFEELFRSVGIQPQVLLPSSIGQLNFYTPALPEEGTIAYLGLFDDSLNMFVFSNGIPVFHKIVKKGLLGNESESAVNDVDLLIQYFNTENPDLEIDQFFVASHIKSDLMLQHILQDVSNLESQVSPDMVIEHALQQGENLDFHMLDERELITFDNQLKEEFKRRPLPFFSSVLGAVV